MERRDDGRAFSLFGVAMESMRWLGAVAGVLASSACGGSVPLRTTPPMVEWSEAVPAGYEALGTVRADCGHRPTGGALHGAPTINLVCGRAVLERELSEQAQSRGGTVLAAERCHGRSSGKLACAAVAARPAASAAPARRSDGSAADEALPATVARRILIDVEPNGPRNQRRSRGGSEVGEFPLLPVGHVERGVMRAHCQQGECDTEQARAGLRAAAGSLGVSDLIAVRCFAFEGEQTCVATLAESERDPETDPRAR
jgi:hypothetical protein